MKHILIAAVVCAALIPSTGFAGSAAVMVPDFPTISSPADESDGISTTPELSASTPTAGLSYGNTDVPVTLVSADWIFYEKEDGLTLLGGPIVYPHLAFDVPGEVTIPPPIPFTIDNSSVDQMTISLTGAISFSNDEVGLLGEVTMRPEDPFKMKLSDHEFIQVEKVNHRYFTVTWPFENSANDSLVWSGKFQATVDTQAPALGMHLMSFSSADFESDFFAKTYAASRCSIKIGTTRYYSTPRAMSDFATLGHTTENCFENNEGGFSTSVYVDPSFLNSDTSELITINADSNPYDVEPSEKLKPQTEYQGIVRYLVSDNSSPSTTAYSGWSEPVSFTTGVNSNYQISINGLPSFKPATTETLTFSLTNNGIDNGAPKVTVALPFSILSGISSIGGGDVDQALNALIKDANGTCNVEVGISGPTIVTCTADELAAGETLKVSLDVTFASESTQTIEYGVCESLLDDCDDQTLKSLTVDVAEVSEVVENGATTVTTETTTETTSGSSSGGGSFNGLFYLFSLILLGVRRRIKK